MPIGRLAVSKPSQAKRWFGGSAGNPRHPCVLFFCHHVWRQFWSFFWVQRILTSTRHVCQTALWSPKKHKNGSWQRPIEWPSGPLMPLQVRSHGKTKKPRCWKPSRCVTDGGHIPWVHGMLFGFFWVVFLMDWVFIFAKKKTYCKSPISTASWMNGANALGLPQVTRWWFQQLFIFTPIWGNDPIWRAYFANGLQKPPHRESILSELTKPKPRVYHRSGMGHWQERLHYQGPRTDSLKIT